MQERQHKHLKVGGSNPSLPPPMGMVLVISRRVSIFGHGVRSSVFPSVRSLAAGKKRIIRRAAGPSRFSWNQVEVAQW